jgi:hypothetical protein
MTEVTTRTAGPKTPDDRSMKLVLGLARALAQYHGEKAGNFANVKADISDMLKGLHEDDSPTLKRYIANDTNVASLGALLQQNPNGLLVFRDELVSLLDALDREEFVSERGFYLAGWQGRITPGDRGGVPVHARQYAAGSDCSLSRGRHAPVFELCPIYRLLAGPSNSTTP